MRPAAAATAAAAAAVLSVSTCSYAASTSGVAFPSVLATTIPSNGRGYSNNDYNNNDGVHPSPPRPSRAYPQGCSSQPPSYYDYENMAFPPEHLRANLVRSAEEFGLTRRLGAGKFSDVFEAIDLLEERRLSESDKAGDKGTTHADQEVDPRTLVVIKCLKPVSDRKVRRELLVLTHASSLPNLARLRGVVVPDSTTAVASGGKEKADGTGTAGQIPSGGAASVSSRARNAATMPSLVLEHAGRQSRWLCHGRGTDSKQTTATEDDDEDDQDSLYLSEYEIKYYLFHLLVALDALHSRGVMHRDVKPRNTLINRSATYPRRDGLGNSRSCLSSPSLSPQSGALLVGERNSLMLVDLGLADFYLPGQRYNVRVASRHYKAPELLVGNEYYDYAVDLWGVGCILAGLLFRREPFFRGRDNVDQLAKIVQVLGPNDLTDYCRRVGIELSTELNAAVLKYSSRAGPNGSRRPWRDFVTGSCPEPGNDALDLLDRLLVYDHLERYTAREAMAHSFFDDVRGRVKDEIRSRSRDRHAFSHTVQSTSSIRYGARVNWRKYDAQM